MLIQIKLGNINPNNQVWMIQNNSNSIKYLNFIPIKKQTVSTKIAKLIKSIVLMKKYQIKQNKFAKVIKSKICSKMSLKILL